MAEDAARIDVPTTTTRENSGEQSFGEPPRQAGGLGRAVLWLATSLFFAVLVAGGLAALFGVGGPEAGRAGTVPAASRPPEKPLAVAQPAISSAAGRARQLHRADQLLHEGRLAEALALYDSLVEAGSGDYKTRVLYRTAVCAEALGDLPTALQIYQLIAGQTASPYVRRAARLGQARVHLAAGQLKVAKSLARQFTLDSARQQSDLHRADAAMLLTQLYAREVSASANNNLLHPTGVAPPAFQWTTDHVLELVSQPEQSSSESTTSHQEVAGIQIAHRFGATAEQLYLNVFMDPTPFVDLVSLLVELEELETHWSQPASDIAQGRTAEVAVESQSLAAILDALLDPIDLSWVSSAKGLRIRHTSELTPDELRENQQDVAERVLRKTVSDFPDHGMAAEAYLALGNLSLIREQPDQSLAFYGQVLRQFPRSPAKRQAWFNSAKVHLMQGDASQARDELLHVVDQGRGHYLEAVSCLLLGRLELDAQEGKNAVRWLNRAVGLLQDGDVRRTAVLSLAAAYLMSDQADAARLLLHEHAHLTRTGGDAELAEFLSALARYEIATQVDIEATGWALVNTLTRVEASDFFGDFAYLLLGQTYEKLGLEKAASGVYEAGLSAIKPGNLHGRILHSLANIQLDRGNMQRAEQLFKQLAANDTGLWKQVAELRLAEMALRKDDADQCIHTCLRMLDEPLDADMKSDALRLMGRAYQQLNDHYRAALCFAGIAPGRAENPSIEIEK